MLDDQHPSHFHRLNHDELWFYHDGKGVVVHCIYPDGKHQLVKLGNDVIHGETPQFKVPKGTIFASEVQTRDSFGLVSCVVAPGFDYHDFELMKHDDLIKQYPKLKPVIDRLAN